jgi:hypothetical protein
MEPKMPKGGFYGGILWVERSANQSYNQKYKFLLTTLSEILKISQKLGRIAKKYLPASHLLFSV